VSGRPTNPEATEWEREQNVECVVCPTCAFTYDAFHTVDGGGYVCPVCAKSPDESSIEKRGRHQVTRRGNQVIWVVEVEEAALDQLLTERDDLERKLDQTVRSEDQLLRAYKAEIAAREAAETERDALKKEAKRANDGEIHWAREVEKLAATLTRYRNALEQIADGDVPTTYGGGVFACRGLARTALDGPNEDARPPLDAEGVLWVAALDRVPIEERVEWVKTMAARVAEINAARKADVLPADPNTRAWLGIQPEFPDGPKEEET